MTPPEFPAWWITNGEIQCLRSRLHPETRPSAEREDLERMFEALEGYVARYGPYASCSLRDSDLRQMTPDQRDAAVLRFSAAARDIRFEAPDGSERTVAVDFDGVLHQYVTPWAGAEVVTDPPVPGALEWVQAVTARYKLAITSTRNAQPGGPLAMYEWLKRHGLPRECWKRIYFPLHKPQALIYLDDRAQRFEGTWPTVEEIAAFRPWKTQRSG